MLSFLTTPNYPNAAIGIEDDSVTAIAVDRRRDGRYGVKQAATVSVSPGVVTPRFLEQNIDDPVEFSRCLEEAVTGAGLLRQKRWSLSLPANAARTAILTIETEPASAAEATEIFDWKAGQTFGAPAAEMRVVRRKIAPDREGRARYFATAIRLAVIDEYEQIFEHHGWRPGLILPRAVSEANWIAGTKTGDSLLLSSAADGFTALLLRSGEPAVVRAVTCNAAEADDEIYRLLMFYNDRFAATGEGFLDRILVVGRHLTYTKVSEIAAEAFGRAILVLRPADVGFDLPDEGLGFDALAAPAGLAALA